LRSTGSAQPDRRIIGGIFVTLSAFFFTLSTVFAKYVNQASDLSPLIVTLIRFMVGFVLIGGYVLVKRVRIKPVRLDLVVWRAILNCISLILFYYGVQLSTVSKANLLNMTFPVFVFLSSPFITRDRPNIAQYVFLASTMLGMYLVVLPDFSQVNTGDLMALLSAVAAGASVSVLKESRKTDGAVVVLFYLMTVGLAINLPLAIPVWRIPPPELWRDLLLSGLCGLLGQACTTIGTAYFSASTSSLVSSSRILFALVIGVWLFADPLALRILLGGALILVSLVGVSGLLPWLPRKKNQVDN
jgi:drug/metabolite transporter (DMT)-like permease